MKTTTMHLYLAKIDEIANEEPKYQHGHDGSDGQCDCIGLHIGALRRAGADWTGTHGSNYAARYDVDNLTKISSASDLQTGDIVFKAYEPGEPGYDADTINRKYKNSGDLRDYYHVGTVTRINPLIITHMTTPTIRRDTKIGKWRFKGRSKHITGGDAPMTDYEKCIISGGDNKNPINIRAGKGTKTADIGDIPQGATADLIEYSDGWCKVRFNGITGYVKTEFVTYVSGQGSDASSETVTVSRKRLESVYDELGDILGMRG